MKPFNLQEALSGGLRCIAEGIKVNAGQVPCVSLLPGKMQGMMSAQTIPAHHSRFTEGTMHGFPLTFRAIYKRMHKGKRQFATERDAHQCRPDYKVYLCPYCCMYHLSSHTKPNPRYEQERWWVIYQKECYERSSTVTELCSSGE